MSQTQWQAEAISRIEAEYQRSADTHLIKLALPAFPNIDFYLKDESTHPTGSLKHRLARSLFLYALCNGWLQAGCPVIEASSGSTAISEAYFARLLKLPFIAVVPEGTAQRKLDQIHFYGGETYQVPAKEVCKAAAALAQERGGHFMDQFTYAERATDWRGNNNIAQSILLQMQGERFALPRWIVMSAGTGGTSATLGRYLRLQQRWQQPTELCVVDPENSVFFDYYLNRDASVTLSSGSRIEGIGRPRVEPSFVPDVVDRMLQIPDVDSIAAAHFLSEQLGRLVGGSTGTNFCGVLTLAHEMQQRGEAGSIVTLLCDGGERYQASYYNTGWLAQQGLEVGPALERIRKTCLNPV